MKRQNTGCFSFCCGPLLCVRGTQLVSWCQRSLLLSMPTGAFSQALPRSFVSSPKLGLLTTSTSTMT